MTTTVKKQFLPYFILSKMFWHNQPSNSISSSNNSSNYNNSSRINSSIYNTNSRINSNSYNSNDSRINSSNYNSNSISNKNSSSNLNSSTATAAFLTALTARTLMFLPVLLKCYNDKCNQQLIAITIQSACNTAQITVTKKDNTT